jgi:S1-C subfamily serine protease
LATFVAVDGQPTQTAANLAAALEEAGVGTEVVLKVVRGSAERDVKVRLIDLGAG